MRENVQLVHFHGAYPSGFEAISGACDYYFL